MPKGRSANARRARPARRSPPKAPPLDSADNAACRRSPTCHCEPYIDDDQSDQQSSGSNRDRFALKVLYRLVVSKYCALCAQNCDGCGSDPGLAIKSENHLLAPDLSILMYVDLPPLKKTSYVFTFHQEGLFDFRCTQHQPAMGGIPGVAAGRRRFEEKLIFAAW
jgi:hypothetical protein